MKTQIHTQRKLNFTAALTGIFFALAIFAQAADPRTNSWFTTYSSQYARIYTNNAMKTAGTALTTWSNGSQTQSTPAYCGVQEVYSSSNSVYIRSTGLAGYTMGPWQNGSFPNLPSNQKILYRVPRTNNVTTTKTITGGGQIGIFVDGVEMFNSWDAFAWNGSAEVSAGNTTYYWNRDAYVNEGATFDAGNAHQQNTGTYHYHANPPALRYLLGDHVDYNSGTKTFSESTNTPTKHSPILGWVADGFPIYGPYGYSVSNNASSGIRRMISGYVIRNGSYGTSNLTANGRSTIPQWAVRLFNVASNITAGPTVSTTYPLGRYMEDNDFLGDHGYAPGTNTYDLDEYNGRWCVTPEFPNGTYAYFVSIASDGTPAFPYNIGRGMYGANAGGSVTSISETVATNFYGGPNAVPSLNTPTVKNGAVILSWSAIEGGTYMVQSTTNFSTWTTNSTTVTAVLNAASYTNNPTDKYRFYRVAETALATYDSPGTGGYTSGGGSATFSAPGGSVSRGNGTNITLTITLSTGGSNPPTLPPANAPITSVTLGSLTATSSSDATSGTVLASFAIPSNATIGTQNVVVTFGIPPGQSQAPTFTLTGGFTINP
jgi:hypothetical protein